MAIGFGDVVDRLFLHPPKPFRSGPAGYTKSSWNKRLCPCETSAQQNMSTAVKKNIE
jgi:hypothetical protein